MTTQPVRNALVQGTAALALTACGGTGSGGINAISASPPPTAIPTPVGPAQVKIFTAPSVGQFAAFGVSATSAVGRITRPSDIQFSGMSSNPADQVQLRYTAAGTYEVTFPAGSWDTLINDPGVQNPTSTNDLFASEHNVNDHIAMRPKGYQFSYLGGWSGSGRFGYEAFGSPTSAGAIPTVGSATYTGIAAGVTDIAQYDALFMTYSHTYILGTANLQFDFAKALLTGSLTLDQFGTFAFAGTNFSAADGTYSGHFDSAASGQNYFLGQLTGPQGQETIGAWAVPFIYSGDGQAHQAFGGWIAKKP